MSEVYKGLQRVKLAGAATLALIPLVAGACGEVAKYRGGSSTPSASTPTGQLATPGINGQPTLGAFAQTDISIPQGSCWTVPNNNTWIAEGDLLVNNTKPFDNSETSGTEYKISGSQGAQMCAPDGGADVHEVANTQSAIYTEANDIYHGLRRIGCVGGCESVQVVTVQGGTVTNVYTKTGPNF